MSHLFDRDEMLAFLEKVIAQNEDPETGDRDIYEEACARVGVLAPVLPIERVVVLSTAHMPSTSPSFGDLAIHEFDEGFQVYVGTPESVPEGDAPSWLRPILKACHAQGVTRLIFDCDGSRCAQFKEYDWDVEVEEIEREDLEAASELLAKLEAGQLQCGCNPSSCDHKYLGDEPGPYPRDRREKKGT